MSCVSDEPQGTLRHKFGARWIGVIVALALIAGPGFFTAALFIALFRDVPPTTAVSIEANASAAISNAEMPDRLLSPIADTAGSIPVSKVSPVSDVEVYSRDNPLKAYLKLTGTSDFSVLPASTETAGQSSQVTYRTVCVRLCDGSYFPISESTTPEHFAANEAQCQSRCGSPARLYVYANGRETPLQMRDLSGNPYLELESAFRFHTKYEAQCSCRSQPWTVASKDRHRQYAEMASAQSKSRRILPIATLTAPVPTTAMLAVASSSRIAAVTDNLTTRVLLPRAATVTIVASSSAPTVLVRAGTSSEIASIEADWARSERIAAVSRQTAALQNLELPRVGTPRRTVQPAVVPEPEAAEPKFFSLAVAPGEPNSAPKKVAAVNLSDPARARNQQSTTEILMRNLNPHY